MKIKQVFFTIVISAVTAFGVMWGYSSYVKAGNTFAGQEKGIIPANYKLAKLTEGNTTPPGAVDFTQSAAAALPTVVHIKTKTNAKQVSNNLPKSQNRNPFSDLFDDDMLQQFFGNRNGGGYVPEQRASGSGVIISQDGFIVTNNHVVENADELTVTLNNKRSYTAKVVGRDPAYDLAVIKIDATGLPFLLYGNSDDVKIGQWVLALGYPLNLETTVTAGIVSAKSRSLGLNKGTKLNSAVESFIQTDAAVNQGNSGGALINTGGELIGINSAIASPTGYYSGYSYAIPVNIVKKVVDDIIKYGNVQRGFLGVATANTYDLPETEKTRLNLKYSGDGLVITDVSANSAAVEAGLKKGDIIKSVNGISVTLPSELQELVTRYKPSDKINIVVSRDGKDISTSATLKNNMGTFAIVKAENTTLSKLGADFVNLDPKKAKEYGVPGGVIVKKINEGALSDQSRMRDGFIIVKVNDKEVKNMDELSKAIGSSKSVTISGFYPGSDGLYDYPIMLDSE
ncbi:trypsin-like peptidase domain-containing protein [Ferruginibacter paludis]|uniref:trypsin-like peptidase domain-containing protein n=1 Tax=Ferruginibacter paludis TaxID=1310417 RepID=UPI0025B3DB40|nr:trypsin-like peptidase domain-containing protein [Ferruginibacter paludis]MDN3657309.1 trypsin-like peptidase domain-containing protein [Ferruginibacter paludis]